MLFGNESISHYKRSNVAVWMTLALQAGAINVGGFMACHRFVSHVTGFATFFGYELSQNRTSAALRMLAVPAFFLFGAMLSGLLVDIRLKLHKKPKYYITFGFIFFLIAFVFSLGCLGYFGTFGEPLNHERDYFLLMLLCLVCGIQNATITTVSRSVVRTTHLTGITTDLGLGIVRYLNRKKLGDQIPDELRATFMRLGIIVFFGLGSILGAFAFSRFKYGGFAIPLFTSGILFATMLYFQVLRPSVRN